MLVGSLLAVVGRLLADARNGWPPTYTRLMAAEEPEVLMVLPCSECGGSGERHETLPGGAQVMSSGGAPLKCRECDGLGELPARVTVPQLRAMLDGG